MKRGIDAELAEISIQLSILWARRGDLPNSVEAKEFSSLKARLERIEDFIQDGARYEGERYKADSDE